MRQNSLPSGSSITGDRPAPRPHPQRPVGDLGPDQPLPLGHVPGRLPPPPECRCAAGSSQSCPPAPGGNRWPTRAPAGPRSTRRRARRSQARSPSRAPAPRTPQTPVACRTFSEDLMVPVRRSCCPLGGCEALGGSGRPACAAPAPGGRDQATHVPQSAWIDRWTSEAGRPGGIGRRGTCRCSLARMTAFTAVPLGLRPSDMSRCLRVSDEIEP